MWAGAQINPKLVLELHRGCEVLNPLTTKLLYHRDHSMGLGENKNLLGLLVLSIEELLDLQNQK